MDRIIGRESEMEHLQRYMDSGKEEFVALYGRRRVGKTFLVRSFFGDEFDFYASGVIEGTKADEMAAFNDALHAYGYEGEDAKTWKEAFGYLAELLKRKAETKKRVVCFIDELPCFDTARSGFVKALDYFWNNKGSWIGNLFFIVCGSATSWMIKNLIDSKGGLHNRITHEMHLSPFPLRLTEDYLRYKGAEWDRLSVLQLYMAVGGVPYYLSILDYESSVAENIDRLFFAKKAEMRKEYKRLFKSLYKNPKDYMAIVSLLAKHKKGLTRTEIAEALGSGSGGYLSDMLEDLEYCDFVSVLNNGGGLNNCIYRLVDFYTLFYHTFCTKRSSDIHFWRNHLGTPLLNTWYGLAFERVCLQHVEEIKYALHLDTIAAEYYSWRGRSKNGRGAQVDLLIDRADGIVTICEIKYSQGEYSLSGEEYGKIMHRRDAFMEESKSRKGAQVVMITTFGVLPHGYAGVMKRGVVLDDLFVRTRE